VKILSVDLRTRSVDRLSHVSTDYPFVRTKHHVTFNKGDRARGQEGKSRQARPCGVGFIGRAACNVDDVHTLVYSIVRCLASG
jgi:hypothetical protein